MKVEVLKPQTTFQLSFSATRFALQARETTRHARSALRARMGRSHGREGRKERSERDSIHETQKILGEFRKQIPETPKKRVEGGGIKKTEH